MEAIFCQLPCPLRPHDRDGTQELMLAIGCQRGLKLHLKVQEAAVQPKQDQGWPVKAAACLLPRIPQEHENLLGIKLLFV